MRIKYGGRIYNVYLEDDGTMDTVISVNGHINRYDAEFASQFRNKKGQMTVQGLKELAKEAIDSYSDDWPEETGENPKKIDKVSQIIANIINKTDKYYGLGHFHVSNMADYGLMSDTINDMVAVYDISEDEAAEIIQRLTHK